MFLLLHLRFFFLLGCLIVFKLECILTDVILTIMSFHKALKLYRTNVG